LRNPAPVCCLATGRDGAGCGNPPMRGQAGCRMHVESSPQARRAAARRVVARQRQALGTGCIYSVEAVVWWIDTRIALKFRVSGLPDRRAVHRGALPSLRPRRCNCGRCGRRRSTSGYSVCSGAFNKYKYLTLRILSLSGGLVGARLLSASGFGKNGKSQRITAEGRGAPL
jgi:hypothetical protein